jgi:hypothetical protein
MAAKASAIFMGSARSRKLAGCELETIAGLPPMLIIFCLVKLALGDLAFGNRFVGASSAISTLDKSLLGTLSTRSLTIGWVDEAMDMN